MIEVRGITLPVISLRIEKEGKSLEDLKAEISQRLSGKLFEGGYFLISNPQDFSQQELDELEEFLSSKSLRSIKQIPAKREESTPTSERLKVVDKSLRSGQRVEHGGDILILGDVNKDAEVVATGNIIVMGTLRGVAIAGALGDEAAVVVALRMEPQQIRIGKKLAISDDSERESPGYPEVAKVEEGTIVLEKV